MQYLWNILSFFLAGSSLIFFFFFLKFWFQKNVVKVLLYVSLSAGSMGVAIEISPYLQFIDNQ